MWPLDPDDFVSLPKNHEYTETGDSLYFIVLKGAMFCLSELEIPRPVTADEFRWLDVELISKTFLGSGRGTVCFAVEVKGSVPENYVLSDLRSWLGRVEPGNVLFGRPSEANY